MRDCPVVVGIFEGLTDGFVLLVAGDKPKVTVLNEATVIIGKRAPSPQWISLLIVDTRNPFYICLGQDRGRVIANHATGLTCIERPHRHSYAALLGHAN